MGIRVHKDLGYGTNDLKTRDERPGYKHTLQIPDDPRWDFESYQENFWDTNLDNLSAFLEWLEKPENAERVLDLAEYEGWAEGRERSPSLSTGTLYLLKAGVKDQLEKAGGRSLYVSRSISYDNEFGRSNVLLFSPPSTGGWSRYDDIIDYYEERPEGRATVLENTGLFPYDGFMKRFRDPTPEVAGKLSALSPRIRSFAPKPLKERDGSEIDSLMGGEYNMLVGRWDVKQDPLMSDPDVLRHFKEDWRPRVPTGILALMEYMGCFPSPKSPDSMLNSLRPMIYVYWG